MEAAPPALTEPFLAAVALAQEAHGSVAHLPAVEDDAISRVALADKVNNAWSILRYYLEEGQALWDRFPERTGSDPILDAQRGG